MYGEFANVAVKGEQFKDLFTGQFNDLLMLHVEELQNENYRNKEFETTIKQFTTREASDRRLYKGTTKGEHHAIIGLNTNQPDLYGLIRGDSALIERLVILHFKPNDADTNWEQIRKELRLDNREAEKDIAYSLYTYLRDEYQIKKNFSTSRYYEQEKFDLITKLRGSNKNSIGAWFSDFRNWTVEEADRSVFSCASWNGVNYVHFKKLEVFNNYREHARNNMSSTIFKQDSVYKYLISKGFEEKKIRGNIIMRITLKQFQELISQEDDIEEVGEGEDIINDDDPLSMYVCYSRSD
jgi:hypothetical protein